MVVTYESSILINHMVRLGLFQENTVLVVQVEQEEDSRWIAEILVIPGVIAYGTTREEAIAKVKALALRVLADRLEHDESVPPELLQLFSAA